MPQIVRQLFEEEFCRRIDCREATAVNSGTSALVGALLSLELNGGEVITTPFTFPSTVNLSCFEGGMIIGGDQHKIKCYTDPIINQNAGWPVIGHNFRMPEPCCLIGYERLKLHWDEIVASVGKKTEKDGYYPDVIYNLPCYQALAGRYKLFNDRFPVAERMAQQCRKC